MPGGKEPQRYEGVENRVQFVALGLSCALALLCLQFWRLQVLQIDEYREKAEANRVKTMRLDSDRGVIYGRHDVMLADNRASTDIVFVPGECPKEQLPAVAERLSTLIGVPTQEILDKAEDCIKRREPFTQIRVKRDVTRADRVRVEEHSYALPGVTTVVHPQRRYLYGATGGHILGYLGEIGPDELAVKEGYNMGDLIGRGGLEMMYEDLLHGSDGYLVVTKYASGRPQFLTDKRGVPRIAKFDSAGHRLEEEGRRRMPTSGDNLFLTLDINLQARCEEILRGLVGAIVVMEADTGAVLAMASTPVYDPSVFVTRDASNRRAELLSAPRPNPMFSRAYREVYPPGSVFKVMMAAAALEEGLITQETRFSCGGKYRLPGVNRPWHCWRRSGHGSMNVVEALAYSCDVFFYNVGRLLEVDRMADWSRKMGLGIRTGIDLPGEAIGTIPDREWKRQRFADKSVWEQKWYPGETLNFSIGQGNTSTTPLQNAVMMAVIVNGGYRVRPHFNRAAEPERSERMLGDSALEGVIRGMRLCVEKGPPAPTGTGNKCRIPGMVILGKTGTAQMVGLEHHKKYTREEDIPYHLRDHAWFVAGVMNREPKIAVCVLVEHGLHGSSTAAPLAKEVIEFFYAQEDARGMQLTLGGGS